MPALPDVGAREVIFTVISVSFGIGVSQALHAAAIYRLVDVITIVFLTPTCVGLWRKVPEGDDAEEKGADAESTTPAVCSPIPGRDR